MYDVMKTFLEENEGRDPSQSLVKSRARQNFDRRERFHVLAALPARAHPKSSQCWKIASPKFLALP
jgi:hypothetical protein